MTDKKVISMCDAPKPKDDIPGWELGDIIPIERIAIGDRIAGLDCTVTSEDAVYAPGQSIEIGHVGSERLPLLKMTRRLKFQSMFGNHSGYLFPNERKAYNMEQHWVVNGFNLTDTVQLYKRKD